MKIALASPPFPGSLQEGLTILETYVTDAAGRGAAIVCFPESFLPGYPGMGYPSSDRKPEALQTALAQAQSVAQRNKIAMVLPMDGYVDGCLMNLAYVIDADGGVQGWQTKNQLDPSEDALWRPGTERQLFEVRGLKFGITICHEGFRYPESVRWAAYRGVHLVFHPHYNGSNLEGRACTTFLAKENPYYEKAMMMRALENGIFFASVNYASKYQESASALFAPDGHCLGHQQYGVEGLRVIDIDLAEATGIYASRFKPELLQY
ncbi:carbon-nitrogen hydrolase family protein [Arachidicoccus terrestris]|uniref:carbon-nitrogen hydrolase family protein n=1 Tax=Arachidicoccus terrestris TaxID=2875539 RepID=UPI001CC3E0E3|nr:carbon-nitrogen hydrolase family protein [Arachidicoccus terrestris]UAY57132.1 carbon-nitrogen hydrolase family protein [Arachidicoccus terrestris]